jgi:hypothetical protein
MNTAVQKTHKLVVGAGVAAVAVIGISVLAVESHRAVITRTAASAPVALPDTSAPPATQGGGTVPPPPMAQQAPAADAVTGAAAVTAPTATPATAPSSQSGAAASQPTHQGASAPATPRHTSATSSATPPIASASPIVPQAPAKPAVVAQTAMARVPAPSGASDGDAQAVGSTPAAAGAPNMRESSPSGSGTVDASGLTGGEVTSTMQARASGADAANPDRIITAAVQSQIAADSAGASTNLSVNTINGVVILTGTAPSADAVDHVKQVVQQVKDVKGVDTTAVKLSGS